MDYTNIPTGLKIPAQIPLDVKAFSINEATLANLGTSNNLAYTYYQDMFIYCLQERTTYQWREVQSGEENTGLLTVDFVYPNNLTAFGVNYSNKVFNFFKVVQITTDNLADEIGTLPAGPPGANGTNGTNGINGINGTNGLNADMTKTSTDSIAIANFGSKTLTYTSSTNLGWLIGTRLRFANSISNYMEGVVSAVSNTSVTITVDNSSGTGTLASWNIGIAGDKGEDASAVNLQKVLEYPTDFPSDKYVLQAGDNNYTILVNNAAEVEDIMSIQVPSTLPEKFCCVIIQIGIGTVRIINDGVSELYSPVGNDIKGQFYAVAIEKESTTTRHYILGNTKISV